MEICHEQAGRQLREERQAPARNRLHQVGGIEFGSEKLARGRRIRVAYGWPSTNTTRGKIAKQAIQKYQQKLGLEGGDLDLRVVRNTRGNLVISGKRESLPAVRYWCRLEIEDMKIEDSRREFDLSGGETPLCFDVDDDVGSIKLERTPSRFTKLIKEVVQSKHSGADGRELAKWVQDDDVRANRRACLLNVLAKLRALPDARNGPLIKYVKGVFLVDSDRVYAEVKRSFLIGLRDLASPGKEAFVDETTPHSKTHAILLKKIGFAGGDRFSDHYALRDFRELAAPSLQAVVAVPLIRKLRPKEKYGPELDDTKGRYFVDLDIDLGVVQRDLLGAITHFGELIAPGRTNHLDVGKKLARQKATKDLIYYRVL